MDKIKTAIALALILFASFAIAQQKDSVKVHLNHYTLTVGAGWTHYINNLENGGQNMKNNFAGVSFKFFWEPEHRLSLGVETGYYRLFRVSNQVTTDTSVQADRVVVPFLLLARMRIIDHFYLGVGMGMAMITSKVSGFGEKIVTKTWSLSNYEASGSYIYPLNKHLNVGGEIKVFDFGKLDDWMYSLQVLCAVRF